MTRPTPSDSAPATDSIPATAGSTPATTGSTPATTVYWRPGCGFCSSLLRSLERYEVPHARVNIWDDPDAAAFVRSVADGNETVPTVTVGDDVALVNPSVGDLLTQLQSVAPDQVPDGYEPAVPGRVARLVGRVLGD